MTVLSRRIATFSDNLYEQACRLPVSEFKPWVYQQLAELLGVDAGIWFSRSDMDNPIPRYYKEDTYVYQLPDEFMENYQKVVNRSGQTDPFHQLLLDNPNQVLLIEQAYGGRENWYDTLYYTEHSGLFDVNDVMSVLSTPKKDRAQTIHVISLYRLGPGPGFDQQAVEVFTFLYQQLVETFRLNLFNRINQDFVVNRPAGLLAVMDRFGHILDCDQDFEKLLLLEDDISLSALMAIVTSDSSCGELQTEKLLIKVEFHQGMFFVSVLPIHFFAKLDSEQSQICRFILQGLSDEDISQRLGVSHRRARYLIENLFHQLKIANRNNIFMLLKRFGFER